MMCRDRIIQAAKGWLDLGLPDEALFELEAIDSDCRQCREVLELKLAAQMTDQNWNSASDTARMLCLKASHEPNFFLQAAYCLHETGDTHAACNWLLSGPKALNGMPIFHYNIACYLWTLGHARRAKSHLKRALSMDETLIEVARNDRDLNGIGLNL